MNKYVFLFELRRELSYMTPDDKEAAARYYEEYFAEAGPENERKIIEELGPPARLAAELRREYEQGRPEPTGRELATGTEPEPVPPFGDATVRSPLGRDPYAENEPEAEASAPKEEPRENAGAHSEEPRRPYGSRPENEVPYGSRPPHTPPYGSYRYGRPPYGSREDTGAKSDKSAAPPPPGGAKEPPPRRKLSGGMIALIVIGLVFFGPVIFGLAVSIIAVVFSLCVAFMAIGVSVIAVGVAAIIAGVWALGYLPDALLMFGIGFVVLSLGLPLFWFFVWSSVKMVRGLGRGIKAIVRKIRGIGGGSGE